jgi:hypothetical protein
MKRISIIIFLAGMSAARSLWAETLEVTSAGVGIGTSSPAHQLEIVGTPANFTQDAIRVSAGTTTNVGGFRITGGTSGTSDIVRIADTDGTVYAGWLNLYADGVSKVQINASAGYPTYFNSGGNVAIGASTAGKKLEVAGEIVARASATAGAAAACLSPASDGLHLWINSSYDPANATSGWGQMMTIETSGNVGIGTSSPSQKLEVNGSVRATSFISNTTSYPDFVFKPGYQLRSLADVEAAIRRDGHLPDIPSEAEAKAHGIDLAAQQVKLLQKVEELTLYVIELKRENEAQQKQLNALAARK